MASVLAAEIASQPQTIADFLQRQLEPARRIVAGLPRFSYVLLAARGSSDHAGIYAQYVWGLLGRLPVALAAPSLHTLYRSPLRLDDALVIGISQSGQSPDVVSVVEEGRRQNRPTLALTNDPASPLARVADHVIELGAAERSIAATKTYTTQLTAVALLAALWSGDEQRVAELGALPAAMAATLAGAAEPAARAAAELRDASLLLTIGRGISLPTAHEAALKLREILRLPTQPFSAADFRHGSIALLSEGLAALLVMPSGAAFDDMAALAGDLKAGGAHLYAVSDTPAADAVARVRLPMAAVPEWLSPVVTVLPVQTLALALAAARGLDPDHPRGLADKIVRTR
jgi:glucosamine--fructose-6-phosphate aminotransferase (isomerizing)